MSQIGTVKVETSSHGVVSIPVFQQGDSGTNVYESVRVDLGSEVGFIPTVQPADATFDYIRFDTNQHGTVAVLDDSILGADIVILIDVSGSMDNATSPNIVDNDVDEFVNQFAEPDLRFSGLDFNDEAGFSITVAWTDDHSQYKTDMDIPQFGGGSNYSDGIRGAHEYCTGVDQNSQGVNGTTDGSTANSNTPTAMLIMGDGTPNDESRALADSDDAETAGIDIFTYTYGSSEVSSEHAFMEEIARNVDDAFNKPAGETPTDIANRIKNKLL